tara:strand:+ start:1262 stop:4594 length:3333 start_codon:yes stop_codon:yes gene_type:complete
MEVNSFIIENILKNITKYTIITLVIVYIIVELITITIFLFYYNFNYNYGNKLKIECKNKNIEYETERYQLYNNILNYIIGNSSDNIINYIIILSIILLLSIIFSIVITYILYNYINDIKNCDKYNSNILKIFCSIMIVSICGISLTLIPVYIGYNFDNNNESITRKFNNNIKYFEIAFGLLLIVMIIININTNNITYQYKYGNIFIVSIIIMFYLCIYLVKSIITYYKKKTVLIEYKNENIKDINDVKKNFLKNELDLNINIYLDYFTKLFKIDSGNIDLNYYTSILMISLILIILVMLLNRSKNLNKYIKNEIDYKQLIECLLYNRTDCEHFFFNNKENNIIYNLVILPIIYVILIIITINSTISYNEVINKNIILHPLIIYKKEINNVNDNFTNILDNDKFSYKENKSVDRNIANTILLVLYNEIFSNMLSLTEEEKKDNKEFSDINILPKFKFIFNNKQEILNYNKLEEYDINNYLKNECNEDIFINTNLNTKCKENNRFILYYIIRSVFLYEPIAKISGKPEKSNYSYYKNILKYKIYISLINYKNEKNYLGNNKLTGNNYEKNCSLKTKYKDPEITKDELLILLGDLIEHIDINPYKKIFTEKINVYLSRDEIFNQIHELKNELGLRLNSSQIFTIDNIIKLNITPKILENRIYKLELLNNTIINNRYLVENIISIFIEYIIDVQTKYFIIYRENENDDQIKISDDDLKTIFKNEDIKSQDKEKINKFIQEYRKTIKKTFDKINVSFSNYENGKNDYNKENNVNNYLLNNYYIANNNNLKTEIEKVNRSSYRNSRLTNYEEDNNLDDNNIIINIMLIDIIILLYYNHYFILEIKNKYSNAYLDSLVNRVELFYDNNAENKNYKELKIEYITKLNELIIILNNTIYNKIENGNIDKITKYINESSVNNYIIDEIIKFDSKYENEKIIINEYINSIKTFETNTKITNIKNEEFHLINKQYINNIKGLENKIDFYINYIKKLSIDSSKYNEKNIEFINNMYTNQKNILEIISNTDINKINFNKILINHNYLDKYDKIIKDYNDYYKKFYNISKNELINKEINSNEYVHQNKNNKDISNIVYQNANNTSNMILILLSMYIIILYMLIKI